MVGNREVVDEALDKKEGLLVLECERRQSLPSLPLLKVLSDRCYGESRILILRAFPKPSLAGFAP